MKTFTSCASILICLALIGCSDKNQDQNMNMAQAEKQSPSYTPDHTPQPSLGNAMEGFGSEPSAGAVTPTSSAEPVKQQESSPDPQGNETVLLDVPIIKQNPELKFGCEVTSLAMVIKHAGINTDKLKLAEELPKDEDPQQKTASGDITRWGNPAHGFVGDVTGKQAGFAVYVGPLEKLMKKYLPNRTVNLTKKPFSEVLAQLQNGKPVIVWTTGDFKVPDRWESWKHGNEQINISMLLFLWVMI